MGRVRFITSLPKEAVGKDFRVLAPSGGYEEVLEDLMRELESSYSASFVILAQRDDTRMLLKVTVNRTQVIPDGVVLRFDGAVGEFLNIRKRRTGNFYEIMLSINPTTTQSGETVGVLRMEGIANLSEAI